MIDLIVSNWVFRTGILLVVFALVAFGVSMLVSFVTDRLAVKKELHSMQNTTALTTDQGLARKHRQSAWSRIVERIEAGGLSLDDTKNSEIAKLMRAGGYKSPSAPRIYTLVRLIMIFVLPGLYLLYTVLFSQDTSVTRLYVTCAVLALIGIYLPNLFVRAKANSRRTEIVNSFPDSLDLMLVCVEAGLGLEAAMDRVGREMAISSPLLSSLFSETVLRMRAGAAREDALRTMADNASVDEIRSFVTLLIQSDKLGTSIATTLRVYSAEMRETRRLRAEEKAHRLPVLISIPLVVFMLPTMIGVLALPAIVLAMRDVIPAMIGS
ncbi:MAG: type II secretion system F family protein [Erythrobacter sp.]